MRMINPYDEILMANTMPGSEKRTLVIAAAFGEREVAHDAAYRLRAEGFHQTWIGIARRNETSVQPSTDIAQSAVGANDVNDQMHVESDNWLTRMFGDREETLRDALMRHGVAAADAAVGVVSEGSAVLTVAADDDPERAERTIVDFGGRLLTSAVSPDVEAQSEPQWGDAAERQPAVSRTMSLLEDGAGTAADYDDFGRPQSGAMVDESTRLQLEQERMRVDKSSLAPQESTIVVMTENRRE